MSNPVEAASGPAPELQAGGGVPRGWSWADGASRRLLIVAAVVALGGMVLWAIHKATSQIDFPLLVSALRATPVADIGGAFLTTALSYIALVGYDISGLRYARARLPLKTVLLASFCGFAIGNSVGLGAFSGGAVRYRLYTAAGLSPGQIARVILFISVAFGVGLATISALGLVIHTKEVSHILGASPQPLRAAAAVILVAAVTFLAFCATRRGPVRSGPIAFELPGTGQVLAQMLITAIDLLAAAATLWLLLPSVGISFVSFATIYATALTLGVLSHVPGGLGVFDVAILWAVGGNASASAVAAALVAYRAIYFIAPLLLSSVLLAAFELPRSLDTETGRRISRATRELAPVFLAVATFAVGATLVVAGAMPPFVDRIQILHVAIPLWAVETSHFLNSVAGFVLLFAARGLYFRLDGAWWLALSMTVISIPFSLVKGLAIVAPSVALVLIIGLIAARGQFKRRASLLAQPLSASWLFATGCVIAATVAILFFAFRDDGYAHGLWWQFEFEGAESRSLRALLGIAMLALALGVSRLLRPAAAAMAGPAPEDIERARRIAAAQPRTDALLALMGDKRFLFAESGRAFLMFATRGRTWAALGDPVGPEAEWPDLIWRFIELADSHGGRAAFYQIPASSLPLYLDAGLKIRKLGEEARVALAGFTLEGPGRADLRYALRRGERDGLQFEMIPPERVASVMDEIGQVSDAWLAANAAGGEKGFSVAAFRPGYVLSQPLALVRQKGEAVAFATLMTTDARDEATVGLMRHKPAGASGYAMEYLFIRMMLHCRDQGFRSFSLGVVPLSGFHEHRLAPSWHRLGRFIFSFGGRFYNFQGLRAFKRKFDPAWEPRYLAASGWFGPYFALVDIAALVGGSVRAAVGRRGAVAAAALAISAIAALITLPAAQAAEAGNFGEVREVEPAGPMRGFVVLFSGAEGWTASSDAAAAALAKEGALVVGVDLPAYLKRLDSRPGATCHYAMGDVEAASQQIQRARGDAAYLTPIVAGIGEGGSWAAAILAQAPAATIAGAIAYDPAAAVRTQVPLCSPPAAAAGPEGGFSYRPSSLPGFWTAGFAAGRDTPGRQHVAALRSAGTPVDIVDVAGGDAAAALAAMLRPHLSPAAAASQAGIADLPLVELPAARRSPLLAIIISGDGGWRDLDKTIAEKLQSEGVSVVGWDSLRYFWSRKSPDETARDLGAVIDAYRVRWGASRVALVGYSFGANVLPFAYDRLPSKAKASVAQISLLGFDVAADFEIRVAGWFGAGPGKDALPTAPELKPIAPAMIQCFYGADDKESACPLYFADGKAEVIRTAGGHHFDNDYDALARRILDGLQRRIAQADGTPLR